MRPATEQGGTRRQSGSRLSREQLHRLILEEKTLISQDRKDDGRGTGRSPGCRGGGSGTGARREETGVEAHRGLEEVRLENIFRLWGSKVAGH